MFCLGCVFDCVLFLCGACFFCLWAGLLGGFGFFISGGGFFWGLVVWVCVGVGVCGGCFLGLGGFCRWISS